MNILEAAAFGRSEFVNRPQLGTSLELGAGKFRGWTLEAASDSETRN
jgi:hypothetical protein